MGCLSSRPPFKYAQDELLLKSFESELGFSSFKALQIDRVFHRYSANSKMTRLQFTKACIELNINEQVYKLFYDKFYTPEGYKMKLICTMGIILSKSSVNEKLKVLFQNYDNDISWTLSVTELKEMVNDISQVACEFIPYHVLSGSSEYNKVLKDVRKCIGSQIVGLWMDEGKEIKFEEFVQGFKANEAVAVVLDFGKLRNYCVYTQEKYINSVNSAVQVLENNDVLEELTGPAVPSRRKHKKRVRRTVTSTY